jgi:hypothetical protein
MGRQRHAPAALPPGERAGTHHTGDRVSPRAGLDWGRECRHHRDSIRVPSNPQRVTVPTELSRSQQKKVKEIKYETYLRDY